MTEFDKLTDIAEEHDLSIYADYSGRGMYGRECISVEGEWYNLEGATGDLRKLLGSEHQEELMGLGGIYYWPQTKIEDLICE